MKLTTQGDMLAHYLKSHPRTYGEMHDMHISTSPQKRIAEWLALRCNRGWELRKGKTFSGLVTWRIVRKPLGVD
mgnify:CR=1 FL=1